MIYRCTVSIPCFVTWNRGGQWNRMISPSRNLILSNGREESKLSVKNIHFPEVILDPEVIAKFQTGQKWDQSLRWESYVLLEFMDSKLQFFQWKIIRLHLGYCTPTGKDRFANDMEDPNISHNVSSINLLKEQVNSKGTSVYEDVEQSFRTRELAMNSWSSSSVETDPIKHTERPVCFTKRTILTLERHWKTTPNYAGYSERSLSSSISKMVWKLVRYFDQDERQTDGVVHWVTIKPVLEKTMTMTMTMTHSEKSHIRRMKAWPYRQEWRGHDPTKKNLLYCWGLHFWQGVHKPTVKDSWRCILSWGGLRELKTKTWNNTQADAALNSHKFKYKNPRIRSNNQETQEARHDAENFLETQWIEHIHKGRNKVRFEYWETSQKTLTYIRAIQRHSGGMTIAPELLGHEFLPQGWKEFKIS